MNDAIARDVLAALTRVLADGGADADTVNLAVTHSGIMTVVSYDALPDDPRGALRSRIEVRLDPHDASAVARADRYVPPKSLGKTDHGDMLAIGGDLPGAIGLEVEYLVTAARTGRMI